MTKEDAIGLTTFIERFEDNYNNNNWYTTLNETEVLQSIQYIIRKGRFLGGFIAGMIRSKILPCLLVQLKKIHQI